MSDHGSTTEAWPPASVVHRIHDRYLHEVVESLNLCPFARRSREVGRVERPLFWVDEHGPSPAACAAEVAAVHARIPEIEIILLTFLVPEGHRFGEPSGFEELVRSLRSVYEEEYATRARGPRFYMVPFHPRNTTPPGRALTPESLVSLIRRTPDPVIQCVRAELLDDVRRQAQRGAAIRFREEMAKFGPEIVALVEHAVQTDPELSSEIARRNFDAVGGERERVRFESVINEIMADRARSYTRPEPA
jgi:hypothetical protein